MLAAGLMSLFRTPISTGILQQIPVRHLLRDRNGGKKSSSKHSQPAFCRNSCREQDKFTALVNIPEWPGYKGSRRSRRADRRPLSGSKHQEQKLAAEPGDGDTPDSTPHHLRFYY